MDISKIRKKARAEGQEKKAGERPDSAAASVETSAEAAPREEPETGASPGIDEAPRVRDQETAARPSAVETVNAELSDEGPHLTELLTFSLDTEEFAFKVPQVEEIVRYQRITLLPSVPDYVAGITSLRGKIIPVIDLKTRLALQKKSSGGTSQSGLSENSEDDGKGKIIILSGPKGLIGAIIDRVIGVVRLPDEIILEPPPHLTEEETRFIEGVVIVDKRFISIIRAEDALDIEVG